MKNNMILTEQQAMDDYSLIIIRQILNGQHVNSIVNELVHSHVPRNTARKIVQSIANQLITSK